MAHRSVFLQESGCEWREGTADPEHGGAGCSYLLPGWDCPGLRGPQMEGLAPKDGTAAHQAPQSLGFSRQEHWSGLPFHSPTNKDL